MGHAGMTTVITYVTGSHILMCFLIFLLNAKTNTLSYILGLEAPPVCCEGNIEALKARSK